MVKEIFAVSLPENITLSSTEQTVMKFKKKSFSEIIFRVIFSWSPEAIIPLWIINSFFLPNLLSGVVRCSYVIISYSSHMSNPVYLLLLLVVQIWWSFCYLVQCIVCDFAAPLYKFQRNCLCQDPYAASFVHIRF